MSDVVTEGAGQLTIESEAPPEDRLRTVLTLQLELAETKKALLKSQAHLIELEYHRLAAEAQQLSAQLAELDPDVPAEPPVNPEAPA